MTENVTTAKAPADTELLIEDGTNEPLVDDATGEALVEDNTHGFSDIPAEAPQASGAHGVGGLGTALGAALGDD